MTAPAAEPQKLQLPLTNSVLQIIATGIKEDRGAIGAKRDWSMAPDGSSGRTLAGEQWDRLDFTAGARLRRPGQVIRLNPMTGERHLEWFTLGLLPGSVDNPDTAPRPIHARAESVVTHPMFADAFRRRRAIVPARGYFQRATDRQANLLGPHWGRGTLTIASPPRTTAAWTTGAANPSRLLLQPQDRKRGSGRPIALRAFCVWAFVVAWAGN
jgi:hypothetical protein